jgi:peptidoglycan-associated lipoprotein
MPKSSVSHMSSMTRGTLLLILALAVLVPSCKKKPPVVTPPPPAEERVETPPPPPPPVEVKEDPFPTETQPIVEPEPTIAELNMAIAQGRGVLKTVYFEFDQYELSDATRSILRQNADWLRASGNYRAVIQGHCDERGTIEYNLALGERRARAVKEYLSSLGLDNRLRIVSFGEERPYDSGHAESSWAKNRRAEFVLE